MIKKVHHRETALLLCFIAYIQLASYNSKVNACEPLWCGSVDIGFNDCHEHSLETPDGRKISTQTQCWETTQPDAWAMQGYSVAQKQHVFTNDFLAACTGGGWSWAIYNAIENQDEDVLVVLPDGATEAWEGVSRQFNCHHYTWGFRASSINYPAWVNRPRKFVTTDNSFVGEKVYADLSSAESDRSHPYIFMSNGSLLIHSVHAEGV